ncbi:hypothetical protein F01_410086 [Burkholderia cenocepacia]|nr:hypothetical protein F01_410086 [Burkholderia cenocepacia]
MRRGGGPRQRADRPDARAARDTDRAAAHPDAARLRARSLRQAARRVQPALSGHPARHHRQRSRRRPRRRRVRHRVPDLPADFRVADRATAVHGPAPLLCRARVCRRAWCTTTSARSAATHDGAVFGLPVAQPLDDDARRRGRRDGVAGHDSLELRSSVARIRADRRRGRLPAHARGQRRARRGPPGADPDRLPARAAELRRRLSRHAATGVEGEGLGRIPRGIHRRRIAVGPAAAGARLGTLTRADYSRNANAVIAIRCLVAGVRCP